jgi:aryl-alcohol dehydrogenase-like predicted oxidoreductase
MPKPASKLSSHLPPLIFGSATLNFQFNPDPYALGPTELIQRSLAQGVRAFDTSPYYGPAESILGDALATTYVRDNYPRDQYYLLTKVGRIASECFDYTPEWIRYSVKRSCRRLRTKYLDVVYCHDVEFVSPAEVLTAVKELRRIRDEHGTIKYVGISGYPVHTLCDLAEMILHQTGEPLDAVMSYSNFNLQNTRLLSEGLPRLVSAGVDVVPNASPLSMGLLRQAGPPIGAWGNWHPAPDGLREACAAAAAWAAEQGEKLEVVGFRFAVENWLHQATEVGSSGSPLPNYLDRNPGKKLGVNVMGVSKIEELDETLRVWRSILDEFSDSLEDVTKSGRLTPSPAITDREWSNRRRQRVRILAEGIRSVIGPWADFTWDSPGKEFFNKPHEELMENTTVQEQLPVPDVSMATLTPPPSDPDNC